MREFEFAIYDWNMAMTRQNDILLSITSFTNKKPTFDLSYLYYSFVTARHYIGNHIYISNGWLILYYI